MLLANLVRLVPSRPQADLRRARRRLVPSPLRLEGRLLLTVDASQYQTIAQTMTFPATATDFNLAETIEGFNPAIGTLTSIDVINSGSITSDFAAENLSPTPATVTGTFGGTITATGPSASVTATVAPVVQSFNASAFDGTLDDAGTSGKDFGPTTGSASQQVTLTAPSDLLPYLQDDWVTFDEAGQATTAATATANASTGFTTTGSAQITVVYHYIPSSVMPPANAISAPTNTGSPAVPANPFVPTNLDATAAPASNPAVATSGTTDVDAPEFVASFPVTATPVAQSTGTPSGLTTSAKAHLTTSTAHPKHVAKPVHARPHHPKHG